MNSTQSRVLLVSKSKPRPATSISLSRLVELILVLLSAGIEAAIALLRNLVGEDDDTFIRK